MSKTTIPLVGRLLPPLALLAALGGCSLVGRPAIEPAFGAPYDVLLGVPSMSQGHRATPLLSPDGRLVVVVRYLGGCSDHGFALDYALDGNEARLWLIHDDPGDPCTEVQEEELAFELNEAVKDRSRIVLVSPSGELVLQAADGSPG